MTRTAQDWCVLRCSAASTLNLAATLQAAGFDVWTPVETVTLRARRSFPQQEVAEPLMPSFVFARMESLEELLALSHSPSLSYLVWDTEQRRMVRRGYPYFRLMRGLEALTPWAIVPEAQLEPLRRIAHRRRPKGKAPTLNRGDRLRLTEGSYAGLYGEFVETLGAFSEVLIDGWKIPVKISTWLLHPALDDTPTVQVSGSSSEQALPAKAA